MKVLKIIGIIILALVLIVVVLGLIAPQSYHVERSIVINAPKDVVFRQVVYWRNFAEWSPWAEQDSTMTVTIEGVDGQEGSKYIWQGDPKITGSGEMTNTGVTPNEEITYDLHFITPWESYSQGYVRVSDVDDGVKASWGFSGDYPFPWNIMLLFMPMDKMIGPDFERGLASLKQISEAKAEKLKNMQVQEMRFNATSYAALGKQIDLNEMESFFDSAFATVRQAMEAAGIMSAGSPAGLYFEWDEENGTAEVAAAIPTRGTVEADEIEMIRVAGSNAVYIDYYGSYKEIELAHWAMMDYFENSDKTFKGPVIEEYLTDPQSVQDPQDWLTRVIYLTE